MTSSVTLCLVQLMDGIAPDAAAVMLGNFGSSMLSQYIFNTAEIRVGPCAPHLFPSNLAACKEGKSIY